MDIENKNRVSVEDMRACYAERFPYAPNQLSSPLFWNY